MRDMGMNEKIYTGLRTDLDNGLKYILEKKIRHGKTVLKRPQGLNGEKAAHLRLREVPTPKKKGVNIDIEWVETKRFVVMSKVVV